ncbi:tRNA (adenosine(37)-N6)-threonylcarbamoyltransferase complex ATPase subunit type 1 TsaE, partial [Staphylococcus saprophyticus]|nr:tRNA (adenosine(37)-N6)-threonylcarbamoyltransferase complex ATPase subunit type 1 TsaE [Staphylococcus saprophyticus]
DEYFEDQAIVLIEWSQFISEYLPVTSLTLDIKAISPTERTIELNAIGKHYIDIKESILRELSTD